MWPPLFLLLLGVAVVGLSATIYVGRNRLDRKNNAVVSDLRAAVEPRSTQRFRASDIEELPGPVRRYLSHVLRDEQPLVQTVRLEQTGTFRSGSPSSSWHAFTATQHVTVRPPGFVWDASIRMMPGLSVRVLDAYAKGEGKLWARLGGVVPVADPTPGPALDKGELLRYLAEAPLYPTALLPGMGVEWTPINDRSARGTLKHRGTTASLIFHVNNRSEVERVTGKRPFLADDGTYENCAWKGTWHNYEQRSGLRVPTEGEVAWIHPKGETPYWRGQMERVEYQFEAPVSAQP
jgi:hypothetical protein